jgi:hypothetical protein
MILSSSPIPEVNRCKHYPTAGDWSSNVGVQG